jgi:hypothetical protein
MKKQEKDSSYIKDVKHFDFKGAMDSTAPGCVQQEDVPDGTPQEGTRSVAGKSSEPGPFAYRFSTKTEVRQAENIPGACQKACDIEEGQNKSKLNKDTPPGGDLKEPGEGEKFETTRIG